MSLPVRSFIVWLALFAIAFINGGFREGVMKRVLHIKELPAHQLSCLTGIILWTAFTSVVWSWMEFTISSKPYQLVPDG